VDKSTSVKLKDRGYRCPPGKVIMHTCKVRPWRVCEEHLEYGTQSENMRDRHLICDRCGHVNDY